MRKTFRHVGFSPIPPLAESQNEPIFQMKAINHPRLPAHRPAILRPLICVRAYGATAR